MRTELSACSLLVLLSSAAFAEDVAPVPPPRDPVSNSTEVLPQGTGRDQLVQSCAVCHPIERVVAERRSVEQWDATIARMVALGARATEEEQQQIFEYVVQFFSADGP